MDRKRYISTLLISAALCCPAFSAAEGQLTYDAHGKRDPFVPLIGQGQAARTVSFSEITSIEDVKLEGIATEASGKKMAIINGELLKEGFKAGEFEIVKIEKRAVFLKIGGQNFTLKLTEEGGQKSER